jgi:hypothetical protein
VSVEVEGEEDSPVEEKGDPKALADLVGSLWITRDLETLRRWGLPPWAVESLRKLETEYIDDGGPGTWQDPKVLGAALRVLREWRIGVRGDRRLLAELDDVHMEREEFYGPHIAAIEDGIAACDWAAARGSRVRLGVW